MLGWKIWDRGWAVTWIALMAVVMRKPVDRNEPWLIERATQAMTTACIALFWPGVVVLGAFEVSRIAWDETFEGQKSLIDEAWIGLLF